MTDVKGEAPVAQDDTANYNLPVDSAISLLSELVAKCDILRIVLPARKPNSLPAGVQALHAQPAR